jgi:hypothetical protein
MRFVSRSRRFSPAVFLVVLAVGVFPGGVNSEDIDKVRLRQGSEKPDDPPGVPARPVPGALPSGPFQFEVFTSVQVNVAAGGVNIYGDAANEPSIAVDPTHPNRMAIGWRQFDSIGSNFREAGYGFTIDGGRTWTFPGVLENNVFRSDPVLGRDANGVFYYASLKVASSVYSVQFFKSWDRGQTWAASMSAYGGDKEWFTVDRTGGVGRGNIYQAWSVAAGCCGLDTFNRSTNGATSFSVPQEMPLHPVWGTLAVASDGTLYVCGTDIGDFSKFYVLRSTNAKNPLSAPVFDQAVQVSLGGSLSPMLGGATPNPDGLLGQVWIDVDRSGGATNGYVYVCASVDPPGDDPQDVQFVRSVDQGLTWSAPIRVNSDAPSATSWQWFATMAVAPNGRIDVVWNDTRNTASYRLSQLFYSKSTNGGTTWSANQAASAVWDSQTGWPNQLKIGDYYDMSSDLVGAHVAWAATFNGEQDVYYLRVGDYDCNSNGVGDAQDIANGTSVDANLNGIPDECEEYSTDVATDGPETPSAYRLHPNFPNPFNPSTTIRYDVAVAGLVRIRIFDPAGRLVRALSNRSESPGTRTVVWNGKDDTGRSVASGVYFCRLDAPGFSETRKLVMLR